MVPKRTYATFADLYHYCYLVASVVGLVCIRIFGYRDLRAEKLAEETGVAFQLTNILRDVAEDAARNRVYLPLKNLAQHNVSLDALIRRAPHAPPTPAERELFAAIARLAEHYYSRSRFLLPLVDPASRPALWVLVSIYHADTGSESSAPTTTSSPPRRHRSVKKARHSRSRSRLDRLGPHLRLAAQTEFV